MDEAAETFTVFTIENRKIIRGAFEDPRSSENAPRPPSRRSLQPFSPAKLPYIEVRSKAMNNSLAHASQVCGWRI
jgi:hypothetical protein